ncbi:MAG: insulinase family protein [Chloroflexaceae bacterium]|nr:insulinase family protein [Chloroflexaceae bacterium]
MTAHLTRSHTLPNNLLVLTREVHSAPVVTCWIWYRVGSRNEISGRTGVSHWVEHMLFKGTPEMPAGMLDRLVARNGGIFNGFTSTDFTAYYETLPADRLDLALHIEADRMMNANFAPEEVERERTVILAELEEHANEPWTWLDDAVRAAAFTAHPYHHPVIGYEADLRAMTRDDLYAHYQTYYMPNNAVLVLVGDFQTGDLLRRIEHFFADLPAGPPVPRPHAAEPEPQGERRVTIRRPGPAAYLQMGFLVPDCRNPDFAAVAVLDAVLGGARSLTFGKEVQTNRSARLYQALVETELASSTGSYFHPSYDPSLFELYATVNVDHQADEVEAALLREVEKIQQDGVSDLELTRIIKQVRAQIAYGSERVTRQAMMIGMWEMLDHFGRTETLLEELMAVRKEDVQRVAQTYLTTRRSTIGHFIPTGNEE